MANKTGCGSRVPYSASPLGLSVEHDVKIKRQIACTWSRYAFELWSTQLIKIEPHVFGSRSLRARKYIANGVKQS